MRSRIRPPIGGSASAGSWDTAPTSWLSSKRAGPPSVRGGSRRRHSAVRRCRSSRSSRRDGSNPRSVTRAGAVVRSAATTRSPTVASARPRASSPRQGRQRRAPVGGSSPSRPARLARGDVGRDGRPVGQQRRPGSAASVAGPAVPPTMTSRPPPASQPRSAASCSAVERCGVDVLPDEPVERAPTPRRAPAGRPVSALTISGATWFWLGGRSSSPTMPLGLLGDDADDQLGRVVDR